jgi:hypothetical protein
VITNLIFYEKQQKCIFFGKFFHQFNAASRMQKCTLSEPQDIPKHGKLDPLIGLYGIWVKIASHTPEACRKFVKRRIIHKDHLSGFQCCNEGLLHPSIKDFVIGSAIVNTFGNGHLTSEKHKE